MRPAPTEQSPQAGEMLKPTLPDGIDPIYLTKVYPASADAALKAGEAAIAAAPANPVDVANVDLPPEPAPTAAAKAPAPHTDKHGDKP
jgi:hypothetical protein